jgi:transcriptional regulator with XRE-family HTH domain
MGAVDTAKLGRRVRSFRGFQGLTQAELGLRIGYEERVVSHLENGRKNLKLDDLINLCRALDVGLGDLLQDSPEALDALRLR